MPKIEKPKTFYMSPGREPEKVTYEDKLPSDMTLEEFRKQHGVVVWCKYYDCVNNEQLEDTQRTTGTLINNDNYKPISEREHVWRGVCTRSEIGIEFKTFFSSGAKFKVPACFVAATDKTGYRMDFSKLLQSDGTPYGGNIDSQSSEHGTEAFGMH